MVLIKFWGTFQTFLCWIHFIHRDLGFFLFLFFCAYKLVCNTWMQYLALAKLSCRQFLPALLQAIKAPLLGSKEQFVLTIQNEFFPIVEYCIETLKKCTSP